jgi:O-antigen ligase
MFTLSFYKQFTVAALLFIAAGIIALFTHQLLWLLLPFAWVIAPAVILHKSKWIFYALIALLPLSTEVNVTPSLGFDFPDEIIMMLLTGIFIIKASYNPSVIPVSVLRHPLCFLLCLHLLWIILTACLSMQPLLSLKFFLAKLWYIVPFIILPCIFFKGKKDFTLVAKLLLFPMAFVVLQSLVRHSFYQFSFEGIKETLSPFFRNHVNYSAMLVCLMPVLWAVQHVTPVQTRYKLWAKAGLAIGLVAVVLAYSRGAWIALIFGIIAGWLIRKKIMGLFIMTGVFVFCTATIWLVTNNNYLKFAPDYNTTIFHKDIREHLLATIQLKDVSNAERFYRWVAGGNMIAEKPIAGFGPNTFYNFYKSYTITHFKTWVSNNPDHSTVHNYFLLISLEQGIPGLVLFCLLFFGMILHSQYLYHRLRDVFYKTAALTIGIILSMIGVLIFVSDLIETDKIGSLFWLCLGLLIVLTERKEEEGVRLYHPC